MTYTLRIESPYYVAACVFEWSEVGQQWICRRSAPVIRWTVGKGAQEILNYLAQRGFRAEWITE